MKLSKTLLHFGFTLSLGFTILSSAYAVPGMGLTRILSRLNYESLPKWFHLTSHPIQSFGGAKLYYRTLQMKFGKGVYAVRSNGELEFKAFRSDPMIDLDRYITDKQIAEINPQQELALDWFRSPKSAIDDIDPSDRKKYSKGSYITVDAMNTVDANALKVTHKIDGLENVVDTSTHRPNIVEVVKAKKLSEIEFHVEGRIVYADARQSKKNYFYITLVYEGKDGLLHSELKEVYVDPYNNRLSVEGFARFSTVSAKSLGLDSPKVLSTKNQKGIIN